MPSDVVREGARVASIAASGAALAAMARCGWAEGGRGRVPVLYHSTYYSVPH